MPIDRFARVLLIAALAAVGAAGCTLGDHAKSDRAVQSLLKKQLKQGFHWFQRPTIDADDVQGMVRRFYKKRGYRPAWTGTRGPNGDARDLVQALIEAPHEGLEPAFYHVERIDSLMDGARAALLGPPIAAQRRAALELVLTRAFLMNAAHRTTGQVNPTALPADWHIRHRRVDLDSMLIAAIAHHRVSQTLLSLSPDDDRYRALRDALARYREIQSRGGWARVPAGPTLKRGARGARVALLQERLAATGDLEGPRRGPVLFDAATEAAVRRFQARHGLEPDGSVKARDLAQLNLPVGHRIRQIELNLERWRWIPPLGDRYVMVNVPDFTLQVVDGGRTALGMRVVVGKPFSRTPIFSDEITSVVINPYWNVPASIAGAEILEDLRENPGYLAANHIHVLRNDGQEAREVDPRSIDWGSVSADHLPYSFRQDPGPDNPVGHIKFMCPNQFDVYLHDTPADHLFTAEERDFSHGCIRVEKPVELAAWLLRGRPRSSPADIESAFASDAHDSSVKVPSPIPVHILYWTAWVGDHGAVQFRDDVYGLDETLDRALRGAVPVTAGVGVRGRRGAPVRHFPHRA